ncbi:MAG: LamG domain-containing protein [Chthoniobacterales bacterium]|nr:LamG domain-containing protein [Chthoniobacterales bacterium]
MNISAFIRTSLLFAMTSIPLKAVPLGEMKKHGETRSNHLTTEQKTLELRREEEIKEAALEQHQESFVADDHLSHSEDEDSEPPMLYPFDFPEEVLEQQLHEAQAAESTWREKHFQRYELLEEQEQLQREASKATRYWDARADRYNRILQNIDEVKSTTEERTKLQTIVTACQQAAEAAKVDVTQQLPHFDFINAKLFNDLFKREVEDKATQGEENLNSSSAQTPTTAKQKILTSTSNFNFCKTARITKALVKYLACSAGLSMLPKIHATSTTLSTGLVGYYPFNGDANDHSGNGNHGTPHFVTAAADRFGNINNAYSFDGSSSYVEVTNGNAFNFVNDLSLSMWVNPASSQGGLTQILSQVDNSVGWFIQQNYVSNYFYFGYYVAPNNVYLPCQIQLVANAWNHLAITKKDVSTHCYLNNMLAGAGNASASTITFNSNLPLTIGAWNGANTQPASGLQRFFNGLLDEIRIYNRTLSASEISQLYNFPAPTSQPSSQPSRQPSSQPSLQPTLSPTSFISGTLKDALVAYYPFQGNARDQSGNGNNGVVYNATLTADRFGNSRSAYNFNGASSYIEIVNGSPFDFANNMSVAFWVKPRAQQTGFPQLLSKTTFGNGQSSWAFAQVGNLINSYWFTYKQVPLNSWFSTGSLFLSPNQWHHYAINKDNTKVSTYLDGSLAFINYGSNSTIKKNGNLPLMIGAFNGGEYSAC